MNRIINSSNTLDISNGLKSQKCQFLFALAIILSLGVMAYEIWNFVQGTQTLSDLGIFVHTLLATTPLILIVCYLLWQKTKPIVEQSPTLDVQTSPSPVSPISPKAEMPERKIQTLNGDIIFQTSTDILDRPSSNLGLHFRIDDPSGEPNEKNFYTLFSGNGWVADSRYAGHGIHVSGEYLRDCSKSKYSLAMAASRGISKIIYREEQNSSPTFTEIDHFGNEEILYLSSRQSIVYSKKSFTLKEAESCLKNFIAEPTLNFFPKKAVFFNNNMVFAWENNEYEKFISERGYIFFPSTQHYQKIQSCIETLRVELNNPPGWSIRYLINGIFSLHAVIRDSKIRSYSINKPSSVLDPKNTILDVKRISTSKMEEIFRGSDASLKQFPPGILPIVAEYYLIF